MSKQITTYGSMTLKVNDKLDSEGDLRMEFGESDGDSLSRIWVKPQGQVELFAHLSEILGGKRPQPEPTTPEPQQGGVLNLVVNQSNGYGLPRVEDLPLDYVLDVVNHIMRRMAHINQ